MTISGTPQIKINKGVSHYEEMCRELAVCLGIVDGQLLDPGIFLFVGTVGEQKSRTWDIIHSAVVLIVEGFFPWKLAAFQTGERSDNSGAREFRAYQWHLLCSLFLSGGAGKPRMTTMNTISVLNEESNEALFERITEEEIIYLWRSIKGFGISESERWNAVVIGLALDVAFGRNKGDMQVQH